MAFKKVKITSEDLYSGLMRKSLMLVKDNRQLRIADTEMRDMHCLKIAVNIQFDEHKPRGEVRNVMNNISAGPLTRCVENFKLALHLQATNGRGR